MSNLKNINIVFKCLFLLSLIVVSCNHPKPSIKEIIGVWKSDEGATIEFMDNGKLSIQRVQGNILGNRKGSYVSGVGSWKINNSESVSPWWMVDFTIKNHKTNYNSQFIIERKNHITGGDSIEYIFIWIGDPDDENRYKFYKIK